MTWCCPRVKLGLACRLRQGAVHKRTEFIIFKIHNSYKFKPLTELDGIMHTWANPHLTILRKIALQHEVQYTTNKYRITQKGNKISDQMI